MKKFLPLLAGFIFFVGLAKGQYVTIPDAGFRSYLQQQYPSCFNGSGMMDTTCSTIVNERTLFLINTKILDLNGIQYFKSLTSLDCSVNSITTIPELPNSLDSLNCSTNYQLVSLPVLPNSLTYLNCPNNIFTSLPTLPNSLTYLNCSMGLLTSLPALPKSLTYLSCSSDRLLKNLPALPNSLIHLDCIEDTLTSLPALPNSLILLDCSEDQLANLPTLPNSLTYLGCGYNKINSLPILPNLLTYLDCSGNLLTNLPSLPNSLTYLDCSINQLTSLPALPIPLNTFDCYHNNISSLPALPKSLVTLNCSSDSSLFSLPTLPKSLIYLNCSSNPSLVNLPTLPDSLLSLDCSSDGLLSGLPTLPDLMDSLSCFYDNFSCLPKLPNSLNWLIIDTSKIQCLPNMSNPVYGSLIINNGITLPLCNPINNVNHCQGFPLLSGTIFYDNNSNGIQDAGELYRPFVRLQLSNGSYTFTNNNGYYEIAADDGLGSYTLFADAPTYYKAVPVLMNYNFTSFDTLVTQIIALQPTIIIDTASINIISIPLDAVPGHSLPYSITYNNVGTTTISPTITINYDNQLLIYDSSSNHSVINNGSSLSLTETNFVPGQGNSFIAYFTTKTTDTLNQFINTTAIIKANAAIDSSNASSIVRSSFDPNDKEATPQLTPEQVAAGKRINYTIRFQNIGTDTAFNIVIADTLSSLLLDSTLQMISSSKPCKVTVTGNVIFFEFLNVLLPNSSINSIGSNGYVSFSVQPKTSVNSGSISNAASIYFDYNTPVVTNIATTLIQEPNTVVPVTLLSFTALTQPGASNNLLYWRTANEINTKSFVVEQSTDGVSFSDIATVTAKGFGEYSYSYSVNQNTSVVYYRLKIIDDDGQYAYSKIISIGSQNAEDFIVLTNPAKDKIRIKTSAPSLTNTNAEIINSEGAVVKTFILQQGVQTIDVSNLADGFYYVKTAIVTRKIVISR